jgi:four helix bundle protein
VISNGEDPMANEKSVRRHHDLKVWQASIQLVKEIYVVTSAFPKEETYGLVSQMRRAAISIPSNIAEGAARGGTKEFIHFLGMARGSLSELETQLYISRELGFVSNAQDVDVRIEEIFRMLAGLLASLRDG